MGVISPYKTFTFDGESSADYGVYLTGEGVFNAPERSVEMVEIPGRNGNFALDKGKFENIEVTYRVGMFDDDEENFADKVSAFRNWLCSKVGYVRLSDDYNPNEYRMAVYSGGLEVDHDFLIAGEAEITFDCKPQRWLTSGETAVAVADGGTIDNPTLFEASPLIESTGTGTINLGTSTIIVNGNEPYGDTLVASDNIKNGVTTITTTIQTAVASVGDLIYFYDERGAYFNDTWVLSDSSNSITSATRVTSGQSMVTQLTVGKKGTQSSIQIHGDYDNEYVVPPTFNYGTPSTLTTTINVSIVTANSGTVTGKEVVTLDYDGADTITLSFVRTLPSGFAVYSSGMGIYEIHMDITTLMAGTIYIDTDIGECYKIENDEMVSVNNSVIFPPNLPTLPSGTTTITYDNTITDLKITPRWWKV